MSEIRQELKGMHVVTAWEKSIIDNYKARADEYIETKVGRGASKYVRNLVEVMKHYPTFSDFFKAVGRSRCGIWHMLNSSHVNMYGVTPEFAEQIEKLTCGKYKKEDFCRNV